jgi:hypothetical protein
MTCCIARARGGNPRRGSFPGLLHPLRTLSLSRAEHGQATVLAVLSVGTFALIILWGAFGLASLIQARAALSAAVDAAALGARQDTAVVDATLRVRVASYRCVRPTAKGGRGAPVVCTMVRGRETVQVGPEAFASTTVGAFGAIPGWAAAAGCAGTVWRAPGRPGVWRICRGQSLVSASLAPTNAAALWTAARTWLTTAAAVDGLPTATVTSVVVAPGGALTVGAQARIRVPLFGERTIRAKATAWPEA